eukprot:c19435_g1_i1.p1 GENE.c19435_g1_i1~~c19435_g1_i1.p1  ORF type:complete len:179 (+),score=31.28 c19435_g1_i1:133-669(+)
MLGTQTLIFALVLLVVILALSVGYYLAFGPYVGTFETFSSTVLYVSLLAFGQYDLDVLIAFSARFATVCFFVTVMMVGLIMLNIFIAVISEVYGEALRTCEDDWSLALTHDMKKTLAAHILRWKNWAKTPKLVWSARVREMYESYSNAANEGPFDSAINRVLHQIHEMGGESAREHEE